MTTIAALLVVLALIFLVAAVLGKLPLWPCVLCLILERAAEVLARGLP
jgi:hypothetical protein